MKGHILSPISRHAFGSYLADPPKYILHPQADFIELPMPSEKNISADTENVSDSIPAIRIKTKEGVSFEVFSNVSTEVLKYLIEVVIHAE